MDLSRMLASLKLNVSPEALRNLELLSRELLRWNQKRNLTAITDQTEIIEKHLVDSLTLQPFAVQAVSLLDIGSGAGFPALPLKIACPALEVVSVDAVGKKIDFQRHIVRKLNLAGFTAIHGRIEALAEQQAYRERFDLVTARALCSLQELVMLASPFLAPGGRLVAMKGPDGKPEATAFEAGQEAVDWVVDVHLLSLPVSGAERCLVELSKKG